MAAFKIDRNGGAYTTATLNGAYRQSFPIAGDVTAKVIEQDFQIAYGSFSALALNTAHATVTTAYLVEETPLSDLGGGIVQWTRRYATKPATRSEYETFSYRFPGYLGTGNPPYNQYYGADPVGRDPQVLTVPSRIEYVYARIFSSGGDYTTVAAFFAASGQAAQVYSVSSNAEARVDYLFDGSPTSTPTLTAYKALVTAGTEIVAEDSKLTRYMGNIYEISTRYVVAH
jgi:hypothetical protein